MSEAFKPYLVNNPCAFKQASLPFEKGGNTAWASPVPHRLGFFFQGRLEEKFPRFIGPVSAVLRFSPLGGIPSVPVLP